MNPHHRTNRLIRDELDALVQKEILSPGEAARLKARFPVTPGDFLAAARAFCVLGLATILAGFAILARDLLDWWLVSEAALAACFVASLWAGARLGMRRSRPRIGQALELTGAIALQGLVAVLAAHHWTRIANWPALAGIVALAQLVLAYSLANRLVLCCACVNFFFFLGAETGYASDWGAYWLGMSYPLRFLGAGLCALLVAALHTLRARGRWAEFSRVYAHFGLLVTNLALWFLSLFGYYENLEMSWSGTESERLLFSLLWAVAAGACLFAGARLSVKLLRGYGLTFLVINIYTFYFQFIVWNTGEAWFLHLLLVGGSLLGLGYLLERRLRAQPAA